MRQIFSVILAAALVFGGALLMAGYFAGIEVPEREPEVITSGPHPRPGPIILNELVWHCPEVETILARPEPGIMASPWEGLLEVPPEELAKIDETFGWEGMHLDDLIEETNSSATGKAASCVYEQTGRPRGRVKLNLAAGLMAKIEHDPGVEGGWRKEDYEDCGGRFFYCNSSPRACGFSVLQAEIPTVENIVESEGTCWQSRPPEVPVERGGRATGGGD